MKKELKRIAAYDAVVFSLALILALILHIGSGKELMAFLGLGFLLVAFVNTSIGIIFLLVSFINKNIAVRRYGACMLLLAGIALLCGFSFCSVAHIRL
ncbi:hypothetical protein [Taibaiella soli]|uniref:Uncharacterized protein n=1 Tax=Taibaiella soli TaxID=1649169 RepID=A0A2W2BAX5_9BACT|nr:hypothetical protein [Taibaiella soli]PZF73057.1 hypothetical protein DN068_09290 [Taibaiella soli]